MTACESVPRRLFALDQNFPEPIVGVLADYQPFAELVPLRHIDARLTDIDDWELLLALHAHERPWDGLLTTDTSMLNQPRELSVLIQTRLTLVAIRDAGHDPVKACGLLFAHLENVCRRTSPKRAQLWRVGTASRPADEPWEVLKGVAEHRSTTPVALYSANRLSDVELGRDPLAAD